MSFDEIETVPKAALRPTAKIKYMRPQPRKVKDGAESRRKYDRRKQYPQLQIILPTVVCGVGKAKAHRFLVGAGADVGKARIKGTGKVDELAVTPRELKHCFIWNFGFVPALGDEIADEEDVECRKIGDDEFEITLPAWFKVDVAAKPGAKR